MPRNRNAPCKYQPETGLWTKTPNADQNLVVDEDVPVVDIINLKSLKGK